MSDVSGNRAWGQSGSDLERIKGTLSMTDLLITIDLLITLQEKLAASKIPCNIT